MSFWVYAVAWLCIVWVVYAFGELALTYENKHSGEVVFTMDNILRWIEHAESISLKFLFQDDTILVEKFLSQESDLSERIIYSVKNLGKNTQAKFYDFEMFKEHFAEVYESKVPVIVTEACSIPPLEDGKTPTNMRELYKLYAEKARGQSFLNQRDSKENTLGEAFSPPKSSGVFSKKRKRKNNNHWYE